MPLVSVVIPLYQTERYIAEAIGSVTSQSYPDLEIIVVDDGSRDQGPAIVRAVRDPRISVIAQLNRGLAGARNTGIAHSRGGYIALLDADDRWAPTKLARHVEHLEADASIAVSFSSSRLIDEDGRPLGLIQSPSRPTFEPHDILCRNPVGNGSAPVIRRRALDAVAFEDPWSGRRCWFDEAFRQSEDIECWMRIATADAGRFAWLEEDLTDYRVNGAGLSANIWAQHATWQRFRAKVASYAPQIEQSWGDLAERYQLRYLARRAVRSGEAATAFGLLARALWLAPRLMIEEPGRTSATLLATACRGLMSASVFDRVVSCSSRITGARL